MTGTFYQRDGRITSAATDASTTGAVERAMTFADHMTQEAMRVGLAGTVEWDRTAGAADIFGVQDTLRALAAERDAAIQRAEAAEQERDAARDESLRELMALEVAEHCRAVVSQACHALKLHVAYEAMPSDRGGKNGPKGKAWTAFIDARDSALRRAAPTEGEA